MNQKLQNMVCELSWQLGNITGLAQPEQHLSRSTDDIMVEIRSHAIAAANILHDISSELEGKNDEHSV